MNILAITKHSDLVERLRTAFEGNGHHVQVVGDHLQALAMEAWDRAHLVLVDAEGDPLDGIRFCNLLRGESRILFQNLPIFLVFDHPISDLDLAEFQEVDVDGFLSTSDSIQRLLTVLGPAIVARTTVSHVPVLINGMRKPISDHICKLLEHFGFELQPISAAELQAPQQPIKAPILLQGIDATGSRALAILAAIQERSGSPYVILVGKPPREALQRKLLLAGAMDWVPLPLSNPRLLHACRRGMEWIQVKGVQREFQFQINDLRERRQLLEMETSALRNEVLTDPLTGLLNRRAFTQNLEHAVNQWDRHRRPFVLILGDLDYFKLVNDRFGHQVGDQVLKILSERMRSSLRRSDLAFRIGGEEFAVILMETSLQAGAEVAEKLRRKVDENPIQLETGQTIFPTVSFGVGAPEGQDAQSLYTEVDQVLYLAKNKGRNRIEVVPERPQTD